MHRHLLRVMIISTSLLVTACSGWFDKDNTPTPAPLKPVQTKVMPRLLWSQSIGKLDDPSIRQNPIHRDGMIYASNQRGDLIAIDASSGQRRFQQSIHQTTSAGPAASQSVVALAGRHGEIVAFDAKRGTQLWKQSLHTEILAAPALEDDVVVVKTATGELRAFDARTGASRFTYRQTEPSLLLHSASTPKFHGKDLYVGYANGHLIKLNGATGKPHWQEAIAEPQSPFSIDRMVDIDADPIFHGNRVIAASYQGKIAALDKQHGHELWGHRLSSYTGMTADDHTVYITDAKGSLFAFDIASGEKKFEQTELYARTLNAPVLVGSYVVVGDKLGYLHFFDRTTGRIMGRLSLGGAIVATPATEHHKLFVLTQSGQLYAYSLS